MKTTKEFNGYDVSVLKTVFDSVCDKDDWKAPIRVGVPGELVNITIAAIRYYTATTPKVSLNTAKMVYIIDSEGYRNGPAGDH